MSQPIFQYFSLLMLFTAGTLINIFQVSQLLVIRGVGDGEKTMLEIGPQSPLQLAFQFALTIVFCCMSASLYIWSPRPLSFLIFSVHTTIALKGLLTYLLWGQQVVEYSLKRGCYHLIYTSSLVLLLFCYGVNYL